MSDLILNFGMWGERRAGRSNLSFAGVFEEVIKREREMIVVAQIYWGLAIFSKGLYCFCKNCFSLI